VLYDWVRTWGAIASYGGVVNTTQVRGLALPLFRWRSHHRPAGPRLASWASGWSFWAHKANFLIGFAARRIDPAYTPGCAAKRLSWSCGRMKNVKKIGRYQQPRVPMLVMLAVEAYMGIYPAASM
jgi:hypothetical protein